MKKLRMIYVEWFDHFAKNASWLDISEASGEPLLCKSCGFLVGETSKTLIVSSTIDDGDMESMKVGSTMHILKNCIKKKRILRL